MNRIGERIKWARAQKKMNQKALAGAAGVSQATISDLERSAAAGSRYLALMARALGVNALWLQTGAGEPFAADTAQMEHTSHDAAMLREMGERIRRLRVGKGMSEAAAGRPLLSADDMKRIEAGAEWPGPMALDLLCLRLDTSLDWLVRGLAVDSFEAFRAPDADLVRRLHDPETAPIRRET